MNPYLHSDWPWKQVFQHDLCEERQLPGGTPDARNRKRKDICRERKRRNRHRIKRSC